MFFKWCELLAKCPLGNEQCNGSTKQACSVVAAENAEALNGMARIHVSCQHRGHGSVARSSWNGVIVLFASLPYKMCKVG